MLDYIRFEKFDDEFSQVVKGSYEYKETLKKYKGKWNNESKIWIVPNKFISDIEQECSIIKSHKDSAKRIKWQKALDHFGFDFVKKGTPEYQKVMDYYTNF